MPAISVFRLNKLPSTGFPLPAMNDRKTLDERQQMTDLERLRHSCAHVMATAILRIWPDAQFAYGPPIENGFYIAVKCYDKVFS